MGKIVLPWEFYKSICLKLAEEIGSRWAPKQIIAISRGGLTTAHIIAKRLRVQVGFFIPGVAESHLIANLGHLPLVFVEDLVAKGRTLGLLENYLWEEHGIDRSGWEFVPFLVDEDFPGSFPVFGIKTKHWIVFPWEEENLIKEGNWSLFREKGDNDDN